MRVKLFAYRGIRSDSSPTRGLALKSFGLFLSMDPNIARKYGRVVKYDISKLVIFDFSDPIMNQELSRHLGFEIIRRFDFVASLDEIAYDRRAFLYLKHWLDDNGYDGILGNREEEVIFITNVEKLL